MSGTSGNEQGDRVSDLRADDQGPLPRLTRRTVLRSAGGASLAAVALAACGGGGSPSGAQPAGSGSAAPSNAPPAPGAAASASASASAAGGSGQALVSAADVPVGGGVVLAAEKVVVTQPTQGQFKGFGAICTHQNCPVAEVAGGTINCNCHGSKFSVETGDPKGGPATKALAPVPVKVEGGRIVRA